MRERLIQAQEQFGVTPQRRAAARPRPRPPAGGLALLLAAGNSAVAGLVEGAAAQPGGPGRTAGPAARADRAPSDGEDPPVIDRDELGTRLARSGPGHAVPDAIRGDFHEQLGDPLDDARLHTDAAAGDLAVRLAANAVTVGRDVYFAPGRYDPGSGEGRRLLAHELAHVVQGSASSPAGPEDDVPVSRPQDETERAADRVAEEVTSGGHDPQGD